MTRPGAGIAGADLHAGTRSFREERAPTSCRSTLPAPRRRQVSIRRAPRSPAAIKQAWQRSTGASFEYLLDHRQNGIQFQSDRRRPRPRPRTGCYQFIDQTWLGTVKEAGTQLGYGKYADAITKSSSGTYSVNDPADARRRS